MKRTILFFWVVLMSATPLQAYFTAYHLTEVGYSWHAFQLKQLSYQVDVQGLFYQTIIEFEIGLTSIYYDSPHPGSYEIYWEFDLPEDAVITDCWLQPADAARGHFISAEIVDLTTAENLYQSSPSSKPRQLLRQRWLRQWDGSLQRRFQMKFSPVTLTKTPVIKIRYLTPCLASYNTRRISLPLYEFNVYKMCPATLRVYDPDNPTEVPATVTGFDQPLQWTFVNGYWQTQYYSDNRFRFPTILSIVPESKSRSYLRIFSNEEAQFYQLSVLPPIPPENRTPKNILLAVDVTEEGENCFGYYPLLDIFELAVQLSTSGYDSITLLYSGFTTIVYDTTFVPVTPEVLQAIFTTLREASIPKLNTLPRMLRQAVKIFNDQKKAGEIWLLTNARSHSDPPATAMEIIGQSLNIAHYPLVFRIINNDAQYWPYLYINRQVYRGNDYLYENLARLSWGSYVKLREVPQYDALDLMLDCIAPTATTVETDPEPSNGLSYSRFPLNRGRVNFPITMPYYEIGLFDGSDPFMLHFFGIVDRDLYSQDVTIARQSGDMGWPTVATFWYARYVQNLLLEPQSYETIKYIEAISVNQRLLTPYSGFIIPGPDGVCAFQGLEHETTVVTEPAQEPPELPKTLALTAYPNPFNPETTISCELPGIQQLDEVTIKIFNCLGQTIQSFQLSGANLSSRVSVHWDGRDAQGQAVASGLYIVLVTAGQQTNCMKITLLR
ncbi:MAG: T9SS type A sorting domain-containing protein [candidate division KSB1 bacterium]|nr:T9SS type A sorting domain-containing protein [candidate division KSB1 bacterium]